MNQILINLIFASAFLAATIIWTRSFLWAIKSKSVFWKTTEFRQQEQPKMFAVAATANGLLALIFLANTIYFIFAALGLHLGFETNPRTLP